MAKKIRDGVSRRGLFDAMRSASAGIAATALLAQQVKAAPAPEGPAEGRTERPRRRSHRGALRPGRRWTGEP